jgi:hypothetical protein
MLLSGRIGISQQQFRHVNTNLEIYDDSGHKILQMYENPLICFIYSSPGLSLKRCIQGIQEAYIVDTSWRLHVLAFDSAQTRHICSFCIPMIEASSMPCQVPLGVRGGASWHSAFAADRPRRLARVNPLHHKALAPSNRSAMSWYSFDSPCTGNVNGPTVVGIPVFGQTLTHILSSIEIYALLFAHEYCRN